MFSIKQIRYTKYIEFIKQCAHELQCACHNSLLLQSCFLCQGLGEEAICGDCLLDLPWKTMSCQRCAVSMEDDYPTLCYECRNTEPTFSHVYALFDYRYPINRLLPSVKYGGQLAVLNSLAELMARHLNPKQLPELFVPVPMHPKDLRYRGYNQALELARVIARRVQRPVAATDLKCIREKKKQTRLSLAERRENVKGLFVLQNPALWQSVQHVAIVDDVVTSGSTVSELSRVLLAAGVKQVDVWCCARRDGLKDYLSESEFSELKNFQN